MFFYLLLTSKSYKQGGVNFSKVTRNSTKNVYFTKMCTLKMRAKCVGCKMCTA